MGYTHSWAYLPDHEQFRTAWPRMVIDAKTIITGVVDHHAVTVCGPSGQGSAVLSEGAIGFNGDASADADYEPFWLTYAIDPASWLATGLAERGFVWAFCKTARRPYDLAVGAVILRAHLLAPDAFAIGSDGGWDTDWQPIRALYTDLFDPVGGSSPLTSTTDGPRAAPIPTGDTR